MKEFLTKTEVYLHNDQQETFSGEKILHDLKEAGCHILGLLAIRVMVVLLVALL